MNKITYPKIFSEKLSNELDSYLEKKSIEKVQLMKKLVNSKAMKDEIFPSITKIQLPEYIKLEPISFYLHICIELYEQCINFNPIPFDEYQATLSNIAKHAAIVAENIKKLVNAGIFYPEWINSLPKLISTNHDNKNFYIMSESLMEQFPSTFTLIEYLSLNAMKDRKIPPVFFHGNCGISRKHDKYFYFITRLYLYLDAFFPNNCPFKIISRTTNIIFDNNKFNANSIRMRINEFLKRTKDSRQNT